MVGVISQFPQVGANFMGAYRDARQARLAEAAARAQMAAAQAERERQAQARASFNRLVNPPAPVTFDTGLNLPGAEIPVAAEAGGMSFDTGLRARGPQGAPVAAAVSRYTPQQQQADMANVFMGGMGQDLAAFREFTTPQSWEPNEAQLGILQTAADRIYGGTMDTEQAVSYAAAALRRDPREVAQYIAAMGPQESNVNWQRFQGVNPETGRNEVGMINPRTREIEWTGVGVPARRSGLSDLATVFARQNQPPIPIGATQTGESLNAMYGGDFYDSGASYALSGVDARGREQWERVEGAPSPQRVRGSALGEGYDPEAFYQPVIQGGEVVGYEPVDEGEDNIHTRARRDQERRYGNIVLDDSMRALDIIYENPNALSVFVPAQRAFGRFVTPTAASRLDNLLRPIGSFISLNRLGEMRIAAETGGALGNVSNFEVERLEAAYGSINPDGQTPEELAYNIARFNNLIYATVYGHDFDGDGVVDSMFVDDDPQETQRRYNYALENGPAGSPEEARARVTQGRRRRGTRNDASDIPEGFVEY